MKTKIVFKFIDEKPRYGHFTEGVIKSLEGTFCIDTVRMNECSTNVNVVENAFIYMVCRLLILFLL